MMEKITEPSPRNDDQQPDPWDEFAGIFKDDPTFDEFVEAMATHRRELDAEVFGDDLVTEEIQSA